MAQAAPVAPVASVASVEAAAESPAGLAPAEGPALAEHVDRYKLAAPAAALEPPAMVVADLLGRRLAADKSEHSATIAAVQGCWHARATTKS
ncbi:MAG TPA: hypothetical protein VGJ84_05135 [Polyangiaceae bacterium]